MTPSRFWAHTAVAFVIALRANAETHVITFQNYCGYGYPELVYDGNNILPNGTYTYTSNGHYSGIAYLQTGPCLANGENCALLEMTLINPPCDNGCGSSVDISLIPPHKYNVETSFAYYGVPDCDGKGQTCTGATCTNAAFFQSNDNFVQVACESNDVNLLIAFCANATELVLQGNTGGGSFSPTTPGLPSDVTPTSSLPTPTSSSGASSPVTTATSASVTPTSVTPTPATSTPTAPTPVTTASPNTSNPAESTPPTPTSSGPDETDPGCGDETGFSNPPQSTPTPVPSNTSDPGATPPTATPSGPDETDPGCGDETGFSSPPQSTPTPTPSSPSNPGQSSPPTPTPSGPDETDPGCGDETGFSNPPQSTPTLLTSGSVSPPSPTCRPRHSGGPPPSGFPMNRSFTPSFTPASGPPSFSPSPPLQHRRRRRASHRLHN